MNILEFRKQHPEYNDMPDQALADSLYQKFYSDMDRAAFDSSFLGGQQGLGTTPPSLGQQVGSGLLEGLKNTGKLIAAPFATAADVGRDVYNVGQKLYNAPDKGEAFTEIGSNMARGAYESIPAYSAAVGGAVGTATGGPAGGVAGAALGGGIGEDAKILMDRWFNLRPEAARPKTFTESLGRTARAVKAGAEMQMGGELFGVTARKVAGPWRESFAEKVATDPATQTAQAMVDQGQPLSPASYQPTGTAKFLNWISENIYPGRYFVNKQRERLSGAINQMRQDLISEDMGMVSPFASPQKLSANTKEAFSAFVQEAGGPEAKIPIPAVREVLDVNLTSPAAATDSFWSKVKGGKSGGFLNDFYQKGEQVSVKDLNDLRANVWSGWQKLSPEQKQLRGQLVEALKEDLGAYDTQMSSSVLDKLETATETAKMQKELPKARYVETLLDGATTYNPETKQFQFEPGVFEKSFRKNRWKLERMLNPEQVENLTNFVEKTKAAVSDLSALPGKGETGKMATQGAAIGAGVFYKPYLAVPLAFQPVVARSLMNPSGYVRRWLTTGLEPPALPLTKEAIKLSIFDEQTKGE